MSFAGFFFSVALASTALFVGPAFCNGAGQHGTIVHEIVSVLKDQRVALSETRLRGMANTIYNESQAHDIDYRLILAIIKVESNFRPEVTSRDGARGLMQIQPSLAKGIAKKKGEPFKGPEELHNPERNVRFGTYHVARLMEEHENVSAALHVYNSGIKKAQKRLAAETEPNTPFIRRVLSEYHKYKTILPEL